MDFKLSWIGLIAVIFGILAIAGIFLDWITAEGVDWGLTGWEIFSEEFSKDAFDLYYLPVVVLVMAIAAIVVGALEFLGMGNMITRIVLIVLGILVIVLAFLAYNDVSGFYKDLVESFGGTANISMGAGLYVTMVGGIGLILAPVLGMLGILPEEN